MAQGEGSGRWIRAGDIIRSTGMRDSRLQGMGLQDTYGPWPMGWWVDACLALVFGIIPGMTSSLLRL